MRYADQRGHDVAWMTAAERGIVYAVTGGKGGPRYTLTGLMLSQARAEEPTVRAWGAVILARAQGDVLRSLRTGRPWHDQDADREGTGYGAVLRFPGCAPVRGVGPSITAVEA